MKKKLMLIVLLVTVLGLTGLHIAFASPPIPPAVPVQSPNVQEVFSLVNTERTEAGEQPLVLDQRLNASAIAKCADMVTKDYHDHVSPTGVGWQSFIEAQVGRQYRYAGENLAEGYPTAARVVAGWMGSPHHKENILDARFTNVGYAVCYTDNLSGEGYAYIVVQHFLQP